MDKLERIERRGFFGLRGFGRSPRFWRGGRHLGFLGRGGRWGRFRWYPGFAYPLWLYLTPGGAWHYYPWWYAYEMGYMDAATYDEYRWQYGEPPATMTPVVRKQTTSQEQDPVVAKYGSGLAVQEQIACSVCGAHETELQQCGACLDAVYYCGRDCQVADWTAHREECGEFLH